jgi:hypothetical protein
MYSPDKGPNYKGARKELTTFAVLTIILVLMTIVNSILCTMNYNKGLRPYVARRKPLSDEDNNVGTGSAYAPYATEMPTAGGYGLQGAAVGKTAAPRPMPARMEID